MNSDIYDSSQMGRDVGCLSDDRMALSAHRWNAVGPAPLVVIVCAFDESHTLHTSAKRCVTSHQVTLNTKTTRMPQPRQALITVVAGHL
jgi:hypothetical protein